MENTTMKQLLILFALFPILLIGQNLPETIPVYSHALQDSIKRWEKDVRGYQGHTLPADPARSKPIWKYDKAFRLQGEGSVQITDLDNGMIRIEKIESEAEFWRRKYAELLKDCLEVIERKIRE